MTDQPTPKQQKAGSPAVDSSVRDYVNEQLYGPGAVRIPAKVVFTGTECRGIAGVLYGPSPVTDKDEVEMWEGEIVFIPRRKMKVGGVNRCGNWRADQIMTSGLDRKDWAPPFWEADSQSDKHSEPAEVRATNTKND